MDSYLVCYDISDPKRLRRVATTCEDFGYRRQLSVFLRRLSATDFVRLRSRLYDAIKLDEDLGRVATADWGCLWENRRNRLNTRRSEDKIE